MPTVELSVPKFIMDNPGIIEDAFGQDLRLTIDQATDATLAHLRKVVPGYDASISDPVQAIEEGAGNCAARSRIAHGLLSNFEHLLSGIVLTSSHASTVVVERQGNSGCIIDSNMEQSEEDETVNLGVVWTRRAPIEADEAFAKNSARSAVIFHAHGSLQSGEESFFLWSVRNNKNWNYSISKEKPAELNPEVFTVQKTCVLLGSKATEFANQ